MLRLTNLTTGEVQFAGSLDGYVADEWTSVEVADPTERDSALAALDLAQVEAWALDQVDAKAEAMSFAEFGLLRRQIATATLWREIQALKLASAVNQVPADALERAKRWPTLMALVQLSGNSLSVVATAAENRLWDRIRRMALWEAKLMLAHDGIRAATTKDAKIAAVDAVAWSE